MISRSLLGGAVAVGIMAALSTATAASAQPTYPPSPPTTSVSATVVTSGTTIVLEGDNWLANSTDRITSRRIQDESELAEESSQSEGSGADEQTDQGDTGRAATEAGTDRTAGADSDQPQVTARGHEHARVCRTFKTCTAKVDGNGHFAIPFLLTIPGLTEITVRGFDESHQVVTRDVTVRVLRRHHHHHGAPQGGHEGTSHAGDQGTSQAGGEELPYTGSNVLGASGIGLGLVVAGAGLVLATRRRRHRATG